MNETTMTLEELCQYAQEAKDEIERERLDRETKQNEAYSNIIKKIVDKLKTFKGEKVKVIAVGASEFTMNYEKYEVEVEITLNDIKTVIDLIPALEANFVDLDNEPITVLEVKFSETNVQLKIPEGLRSEDK